MQEKSLAALHSHYEVQEEECKNPKPSDNAPVAVDNSTGAIAHIGDAHRDRTATALLQHTQLIPNTITG